MELIGMCDRIIIMKDGKINGELLRSQDMDENPLIEKKKVQNRPNLLICSTCFICYQKKRKIFTEAPPQTNLSASINKIYNN